MDLVFATECRFEKGADGGIYSVDSSYDMKLWSRYLSFFDNIIVVGRVGNSLKQELKPELLIKSDRISFVELPYYIGPLQYLKNSLKIKKIIRGQAMAGRAYLCRVPGQIGGLLIDELHRNRIPFAVEVVGDPWDVFAPGSIKHPLRPFFRVRGYLSLRRITKLASALLYVTETTLQKRYKSRSGVFTTNASNVILSDNKLAVVAKKYDVQNELNIISVGSLAQMYKSPDVVINALAILKQDDIKCKLIWLGDGVFKNEMINFAQEKGVSEMINFIGNVSSEDVRVWLEKSDLFILASRTEGLPRAVVEAMGMGLPCIGSRVGGIPELLDDIALVDAGDEVQLAEKIKLFITDNELINDQAKRNIEEAQKYKESVLVTRRGLFYDEIKKVSK